MEQPLKNWTQKYKRPLGNKALAARSRCSCSKYYMTVIFLPLAVTDIQPFSLCCCQLIPLNLIPRSISVNKARPYSARFDPLFQGGGFVNSDATAINYEVV